MSSTTPDHPLQWGAATIAWTPSGYVLSVPMYLDARATQLLETSMPDVPGAEVDYLMRPAVWTKVDSGTSVEPGELQISSQVFFDFAPEELKRLLDQASTRASNKAAKEEAHDDEMARRFLVGLRDA
jgi:hypothetical protein